MAATQTFANHIYQIPGGFTPDLKAAITEDGYPDQWSLEACSGSVAVYRCYDKLQVVDDSYHGVAPEQYPAWVMEVYP